MTYYYTVHPLDQALQNLPDEVSPQVRLNVVWRFYENATGESIGDSPDEEQRKRVHQWLREQRGDGTGRRPMLTIRRPRFVLPVAQDIPLKVMSLTQHLCNACEPIVYEDGSIPMIVNMPIKVPPWSAQSVKAIQGRNTAIKDAIREQLSKRNHREPWADSPICLSVAAVVPRASRYIKDVDNLVKGLLDSLASVLYVNDKQVQCLTTRRFEYSGDIGFYQVGARAVYPWDVDIIYDNPVLPHFASGFLDLPETKATEK